MIDIHVCANNVSIFKSEVTKSNIAETSKLANAMPDAIVFSGNVIYSKLWSQLLGVQMVHQQQCGL